MSLKNKYGNNIIISDFNYRFLEITNVSQSNYGICTMHK